MIYQIVIKATGEVVGTAETNRSAVQAVRYKTLQTGLKEEDYDIIPVL